MGGERGGPITGFLVGIGAIVVFFGLLAVACGACTSNGKDNNHSLGPIQLISHHHDDCRDDGYCGDDGDGSGNGNSGGRYGGGHSGDQGGRDGSCRNFCNITVPTPPMPGQQPKGFIPPNPGKIGQQVADFIKLVSDFVQGVVRFAV